jgi:competence protein ComEC
LFAALAAGIVLGDAAPVAWLWAGALALGGLLTVLAWRAHRGLVVAALGTLAATGALSAATWRAPPSLASTCAPTDGRWRAVVDGPIERAIDPVSGHVSQRTFLADLWERCGDGEQALWRSRAGRVRVSLRGAPAVARGDRIDVRLRLEPIAAPLNPVGRDGRDDARRHGLVARAHVTSTHALVQRGAGLRSIVDRWRASAARRIEARFEPRVAALAKALALGDRASIDDATRDRWGDAGVAHLLAISGLHVGLIAWLVFTAVGLALRRWRWLVERTSTRRVAALVGLLGTVGFCLWTGASASAVRATIMVGAYLGGLVLGRPSNAANALGVAGVGILVVDPMSLYDVGFLLSFVAVGALLVIPALPPARSRGQWLGRVVAASAIASAVATVATAPITAGAFGYVSLAAPLTNIVAVPWGTLVAVPGALLYCAVAPLGPGVDHVVGELLRWALVGLDGVATLGASIPMASVGVPRPNAMEVGAYAALVLSAAAWLRWRRARWGALAASLVLCGCVAGRLVAAGGDGALHVWQPYVGEGGATIVRLPEGGVVLYDAGGSLDGSGWDPGRGVVAPWLRSLGVVRVNLAIVSHPHPDHVGGMRAIAARFPIDELWWSGNGEDNPMMQEVVAAVRAAGGRARTVAEVPAQSVREGVSFEVLHPHPGAEEGEGLPYFPGFADNDNSLVLRLRLGERTLLLPGDIEQPAEALLVGRGLHGPVDLMTAPHHGSSTSSSPELIDAVAPRMLWISCGVNNRFGFPNPDVLERYASRRIPVLRTDVDGALHAHTDGTRWWVETHRGAAYVLASEPPGP